jgi:hypothetical protein
LPKIEQKFKFYVDEEHHSQLEGWAKQPTFFYMGIAPQGVKGIHFLFFINLIDCSFILPFCATKFH